MTGVLHLLQVEDSPSDAGLIVRLLQKAGYRVEPMRVDDAAGMREALRARPWDVIICDHRMGGFDAPGALRILRDAGLDIPFIVVSGSIGEDLAVSLMKAGAQDYLLKSNLMRLAPAVEREVREAQMRRERRRADAELRESEERLALVVQATKLGTFDFDPASGRLLWSDAARRHFGLSPEAPASYEVFLRALHPAERERVHQAVQSAMRPAGSGQYTDEFRAVGIEDGVERWLASRGEVFFDSGGQPVRFVGVILDITERKKLEEQFRQAQKLESIGRLAGGVAHDFNNLLTVITGYAEMILSDLDPQNPLRDSIEEIGKAAARASDLTRQLLAFSRRSVVEPRTIVVNDLLRNFQKMLGRLLGEQVDLVLALEDAGCIRADAGQIEQVVMNLAVNAKDAMPAGGRLLIETSQLTADDHFAQAHPPVRPGRYVMISVSDTGVGMPEEVKAHVFEPFFTTKESGKGTGLGLSTVYGIVQQAGGSVTVYSEPGRGTTFKLLFPAVDARAEAPQLALAEVAQSGADYTVLLVEDEAGVRKYAHQVLERHGYIVLTAANGREAIEVARNYLGTIDLALLDVVLPGMSAADLTSQLKQSRADIPVLCMSGYSERLLPETGLGPHFIQKPFTPVALLTRIRSILEKTASRL